MENTLMYAGEFLAVDGVRWKVEIHSANISPGYEPRDLVFPASSPLELEWEETDKIQPLQGSIATLRVECLPGYDFTDLYTIAPGEITLRVYRDGSLYWTGCLDPEFYEQPNERLHGFDVTLTFSDMGILDRIKWSKETQGYVTLDSIVRNALSQARLPYEGYSLLCSSYYDQAGNALTLDGLSVSAANFIDEEGEPSTMREVLEGILQPLALRMIQRAGTVYIYDLNALSLATTNGTIEWTSDSSTLSADKVVSDVTVTFSPYDRRHILDGAISSDDVTTGSNSWFSVKFENTDTAPDGFAVYKATPKNADSLPYSINTSVGQLVKVKPALSGEDDVFVLLSARPDAGKVKESQLYRADSNEPMAFRPAYPNGFDNDTEAKDVIIAKGGFIAGNTDPSYQLRVSIKALVDVRYNPYESEGLTNEEGNWDRLKNWCNFGYFPGSLLLKDGNGNTLYHYDNRVTVGSVTTVTTATGKWKQGQPSRPDTYLMAFYDPADRKSSTGFGGWKTNRRCLGYYRGKLPIVFERCGDGDLIPIPPAAGYLELRVMNRVHQFDYGRESKDIYPLLRWMALKEPSITLVDSWGNDPEPLDLEYKTTVNASAREEMAIDTICGTSDRVLPTALGLLYRNGRPVNKLVRADVHDTPEKLLAATVYSHYATRHVKLSGECHVPPSGLPVMTESHQPGRRFTPASERQDCRMGAADVTWVEVLPDNYQEQ